MNETTPYRPYPGAPVVTVLPRLKWHVASREYVDGTVGAVTYTNRTQAEKAAKTFNASANPVGVWSVLQSPMSRVFFVCWGPAPAPSDPLAAPAAPGCEQPCGKCCPQCRPDPSDMDIRDIEPRETPEEVTERALAAEEAAEKAPALTPTELRLALALDACRLAIAELRAFHSLHHADCPGGCPCHEAIGACHIALNS